MAFKEHSQKIASRAARRLSSSEEALGVLYSKLVTERRWFVVLSAAAADFWEKKLYYFTGHFTYSALLAVLAMAFALASLVGLVLRADPGLQGDIRDAMRTFIPIIGGTPDEMTRAMIDNTTVTGIIGIFGLLWTGTKIFSALESGFCQIWEVPRRSFVKRKGLGFLMISVVGAIVIVSIVIQLAFAAVWGWMVGAEGFWYSAGKTVLRPLLGFAVNFALFLFFYQVIPPVRQSARRSMSGSAVAAAFFLGLQYLLAFYFGSISNLPSVYGSMATVVVLVVWLHITGMVIFMGAEIIHAMYDEEMVESHRRTAVLPGLFKTADRTNESLGDSGDKD